MIKWVLYHKDFTPKYLPDLQHKINVNNYILSCDLIRENSYMEEDNSGGIFIFGYILPRLNFTTGNDLYKEIYLGIKNNGTSYINNYKGNFVIITFFDKKIIILNDQFGIGKYFYSQTDAFLASNHLSFLHRNLNLSFSRKNIINYYLFNYMINGQTIFENCNYSTGGIYHELTNTIKEGQYFKVKDFIDNRKVIYGKKESLNIAADLWKKLIKQYINSFESNGILQTLTAGMDSRMILAGFRANNYQPATFTFGRGDSLDVIHAKKIAGSLNLKHFHLYPPEDFFNQFQKHAEDVIKLSSGMSSIFRAHRLEAYREIQNQGRVLFFGFIGSEIIRGLYPDGLTVPKIVSDYWLNKDFTINEYFPRDWFDCTDEELQNIKEQIINFDFIDRPDLFLFKVMIPLHFGQDIGLCDAINIHAISPFWDIDFLDFQKNTTFFTDNNKKEDFAKIGHYQRRKGPFFSANIISMLDKKNAKLSLGKGYSPYDYKISMFYAAIKFMIYKKLHDKDYQIPNFDYNDWFKKYLQNYFETNEITFVKEINNIKTSLQNIKSTDELKFLNHVKLININSIINAQY